jgi:hypothetical protein
LVGEGKPDNGNNADQAQQYTAPAVKKSTSQRGSPRIQESCNTTQRSPSVGPVWRL